MEPQFLSCISLVIFWNLFGNSMSECVNSMCENFESCKSQYQDFRPFFEEETRVYAECCNLCASMDKCTSFNYDVKTHKCSLLANASEALTQKDSSINGKYRKESEQGLKHVCRSRPCKPDQVCVTTMSGNGYICLQGSTCLNTPPIEHMTSEKTGMALTSGQAIYNCDTGFQRIKGSGHSDCTEDGKWTKPSLVCRGINCGHPPTREHQPLASVESTLYLDRVEYMCATGYNQTEGSGASSCQADGTWSVPTLRCNAIDCGTPSPRDNMKTDAVFSTLYPARVEYTCATGYNQTEGSGASSCQADGTWSVPTLRCKAIDCGTPSPRDNMKTDAVFSTLYPARVEYTCATGYNQTEGSGASSCQADGTWSVLTLRCKVVDCGKPPGSNLHHIRFVDTTYQSSAVYQCGLGYYIPGDGISVCQADGQWSQTCQGIPNLTGTKLLPALSVYSLECKNVMSDPVNTSSHINNADVKSAVCAHDEILTGCSASNPDSKIHGSWILGVTGCATRHYVGAQSVARCCKIPGLQCEYIKSESASLSCYKNFQLLDCVCWEWGNGACYSTMTNNTCQLGSSDGSEVSRNVYAVCCTYDNLICYVKEGLGDVSSGSLEMTITCGPGETMTACSGFNTDKEIQQALIEDRDGVDTCVVLPGQGSFSTLKGYVSCCKYKSKIGSGSST